MRMPWIGSHIFRYKRALLFLASFASICCILLFSYSSFPVYGDGKATLSIPVEEQTISHLPAEYTTPVEESRFCAERFGTSYLEKLHDSATQYCNESTALTCFHSKTVDRWDSFCFGKGARFDPLNGTFHLQCDLQQHPSSELAPVYPYPERFHQYMYDTGPGVVFDSWINLDAETEEPVEETTNYTILVKREGASNHWHSLMEIFSMTLTMDVLQMMQPSKNLPVQYIAERDAANTQLVLLDDEPDGPYFDLWSLFAKKQVVRLKDLSENTTLENIIVPLPGGSNTLWQGDWDINPCERSTNLNTFAGRVLDVYGIKQIVPRQNDEITFTFINRVSGRRLVDMEEYLDQLSKIFPRVKIQSIDFAAISYKDQLEIIQNTDILAGIHGAGLTHGIFLPPGSAMVEILPYDLNHKGFRNVAALRGHGYFSIHAYPKSQSTPIEKRGWNGDDVHIEIERFLDVMSVAIRSMYNKGLRNYDIN